MRIPIESPLGPLILALSLPQTPPNVSWSWDGRQACLHFKRKPSCFLLTRLVDRQVLKHARATLYIYIGHLNENLIVIIMYFPLSRHYYLGLSMKNSLGISQSPPKKITRIVCHAYFYNLWFLKMEHEYRKFFKFFQNRYLIKIVKIIQICVF